MSLGEGGMLFLRHHITHLLMLHILIHTPSQSVIGRPMLVNIQTPVN